MNGHVVEPADGHFKSDNSERHLIRKGIAFCTTYSVFQVLKVLSSSSRWPFWQVERTRKSRCRFFSRWYLSLKSINLVTCCREFVSLQNPVNEVFLKPPEQGENYNILGGATCHHWVILNNYNSLNLNHSVSVGIDACLSKIFWVWGFLSVLA